MSDWIPAVVTRDPIDLLIASQIEGYPIGTRGPPNWDPEWGPLPGHRPPSPIPRPIPVIDLEPEPIQEIDIWYPDIDNFINQQAIAD